jgi:hypothetical protein
MNRNPAETPVSREYVMNLDETTVFIEIQNGGKIFRNSTEKYSFPEMKLR